MDYPYDAETLSEYHLYTTLAGTPAIVALLGNGGVNTITGRPQIYHKQAPQVGSTMPFGIYSLASDVAPLVAIGNEYVTSDGLWLVKWCGFDYQEDVLRQLNKLAVDALAGNGPVYPGLGRIIDCAWENTPVLPDELLQGGAIVVARGQIFRILPQPDGVW